MSGYTAWVRNQYLERVARISFDSLRFRRSWLDFAGWEMRVTRPEPAHRDYVDHTDALNALLTAGSGITVEDEDGRVVCSGWAHLTEDGTATAFTREKSVDQSTGATTDLFVVAGRDDMAVLADRLAAPDPTFGLTGKHRSHYVASGVASDVVRDLVLVNAGDLATVERRTFGLVVPTVPSVGGEVGVSCRWSSLLTVVQEVCVAAGLTVEVSPVGESLVVSIGETVDRSDGVMFAVDSRTLQGASISSSITEATSVLVAGQGELTERAIVEVVKGDAVRRMEAFLDRRDLADALLLEPAGRTWLGEVGGAVSVTVEPDLDPDGAIFGVDYRLGDLVGVGVVEGGPIVRQRVTGIDVDVSDGRVDRLLRLGPPDTFGGDAMLSRLNAQAVRIARLEKS